ncbi:MAG: SDR family oxidoreductase [Labilithrix sp.]|nr:SDR family oxidoreductase [Labilithrix sp.]
MANWIVTGSNRGIGLEMCRQLHARGDTVFAACRRTSKELDAIGCKVIEGVDVADDAAGRTLLEAIGDAKIDVLVNNAGVLVGDQLATLDFEAMKRQYDVNTIGPLRVTAALLPRLGRGAKIGFVSSRAGSIGDGPSGGLYGYRVSKAALNMAGVNLARDLASKGILVALLHPGFVRTEMTGGAGNEDPPAAARGLLARLDELTPDKSGRFFHANGQELPW